MNVLLIGMPGAGKSTLSKPLADRLRKKHIEIDAIIEEYLHMDLQAYIDAFGNEAFKEKERQIIMNILQNCENCVISPPGSLIYYDEIKAYVHDHPERFLVIYLHCNLSEILERTNYFNNRGVVFDKEATKAASLGQVHKAKTKNNESSGRGHGCRNASPHQRPCCY